MIWLLALLAALICDVAVWHELKAGGHKMTTYPLLYRPFVWAWRRLLDELDPP